MLSRLRNIRNLMPYFASMKLNFHEGKYNNCMFEPIATLPNELKAKDLLEKRHLGPSKSETRQMLEALGVSSVEELMEQTIPSKIYIKDKFFEKGKNIIPPRRPESIFQNMLKEIASKNKIFKTYIGCGYHPTIMPNVILRNVLENPAWYTSYTPYQAEISQGRLEALLVYQTMISELTKMEVANASLLDEASAAAEAMYMCYSSYNHERKSFFVAKNVFPHIKSSLKTRAKPFNIQIIENDPLTFNFEGRKDICGIVLQTPDNEGFLHNYSSLIQKLHKEGIYSAVCSDLYSLILSKPQGEVGADIAFGSTQRFGIPMGFGGPYAAYLSTTNELIRKMPGRLIGISQDAHGNKAYRMALGTREQHIKRERATSNICTAQALLANLAGFYGVWHGPEGLIKIATRIRLFTTIAKHTLENFHYNVLTKGDNFFDTITLDLSNSEVKTSDKLIELMEQHKINIRKLDDTKVSFSLHEKTTLNKLHELLHVFEHANPSKNSLEDNMNLEDYPSNYKAIPEEFARSSKFMEQDIFNKIHSEHQMLRYLYKLQLKDYNLANGMIPLGSCTMKLNSTSSMIPITWPEFANIHPMAPSNQTEGFKQLIQTLQGHLKTITGLDGVSLQPNSGAHGELTGLLTIKTYLNDIGQSHRKICLIPNSAHGTNPASAIMAGLEVVPVKCESNGDISVKDLKEKAKKYEKDLACIMITYPSTHGVFEEGVTEIIDFVHKCGGQVYMDGANMNAQVGFTNPGYIGADVCHLNLHKTFGIPHGGGGPGVGPICVKKHLIPYLPSSPIYGDKSGKSLGSVSAAEYGSAGIFPICYSYIELLGRRGLRDSTAYSVMNANYVLTKLKDNYRILYTGSKGRCAHEFILDLRQFKASCGVTEEDVAKRLMDYGFHPPTVSFPVAGCLMFEPTESEDKGELDRFCEAMLSIREEIREIEESKISKTDNPLKNAPHCLSHVSANEWAHPYSREKAAYPLNYIKNRGKFWPTVGRINNVLGDKNLILKIESKYDDL